MTVHGYVSVIHMFSYQPADYNLTICSRNGSFFAFLCTIQLYKSDESDQYLGIYIILFLRFFSHSQK